MRTVLIGGATLHVRVDGPRTGAAVVFSNSLGTDFRIWDRLVSLLPAGLRVIRYDKRGHGLSDCPEGDWGMEEHVTDLAALLDHLGVTRAVVVGLSVGGQIAQGLAAERRDLVSGLVLMDTAAKIGTAEMWADRIGKIEAGGIEAVSGSVLERWFTVRFREGDPAFPIYRNMLRRTPVDGYLKTCAAIRDTDFTAAAGTLDLPVLAIAGSEDGSTPPALVRGTADLIPGARYEEIADAGHLPCVEQPAESAALICRFLQEIGHV